MLAQRAPRYNMRTVEPNAVTAESLFQAYFLPLYPDDVRDSLRAARSTDANPAKNPAVLAHLDDAAARFVALAPWILGGDPELDYSDESVHRLSRLLTLALRSALSSRGEAGSAENELFNVVVHGAAYVGACVVRSHGGAWSVRRPLWESVVTLESRAGKGDLPVFHWWLKSLSDAALAEGGSGTLADRYRASVEIPCARPEDWPVIAPEDRELPRITKVRYDVLYKYLKAHLPELKDLGEHFPTPERFEELGFKHLDLALLGGGRVLLMHGLGRAGLHLFFLTKAGFDKALYYPADAFPEPLVKIVGDKLQVHLSIEKKPQVHEMLFWGI